MARPSRAEVFDPNEVAIAHVFNRTVRRCFLMGDDAISGNNFDHRKVWIEEYLRQFAAFFGIDLICYALMSNHFHLILRSRPDVVATWDNREVARRWLMICPERRSADLTPLPPSEAEINSIANCPVKCQDIRKRLSNFSWWMRLLCQRVAQRSNNEEKERGKFFQDRYGATRLTDEASLLACAAYVDLNPIRAAMAMTLASSDHTSVQTRIKALATHETDQNVNEQHPPGDAFLSPLTINEQADPIGPSASQSGKRCSDKGVLAMPIEEYLALLDWTARLSVPSKRGSTPGDLPPVLSRLGLDGKTWCELVRDFGKLFYHVAGRPEHVDTIRSHRTHRRYYLRRRVRELFAAT